MLRPSSIRESVAPASLSCRPPGHLTGTRKRLRRISSPDRKPSSSRHHYYLPRSRTIFSTTRHIPSKLLGKQSHLPSVTLGFCHPNVPQHAARPRQPSYAPIHAHSPRPVSPPLGYEALELCPRTKRKDQCRPLILDFMILSILSISSSP